MPRRLSACCQPYRQASCICPHHAQCLSSHRHLARSRHAAPPSLPARPLVPNNAPSRATLGGMQPIQSHYWLHASGCLLSCAGLTSPSCCRAWATCCVLCKSGQSLTQAGWNRCNLLSCLVLPCLVLSQPTTAALLQGPGDLLFVPSGWHHSVRNEADTLSINHNWLNAHNVHWAVALLRSERQEAIAAIEDCRCSWRCQKVNMHWTGTCAWRQVYELLRGLAAWQYSQKFPVGQAVLVLVLEPGTLLAWALCLQLIGGCSSVRVTAAGWALLCEAPQLQLRQYGCFVCPTPCPVPQTPSKTCPTCPYIHAVSFAVAELKSKMLPSLVGPDWHQRWLWLQSHDRARRVWGAGPAQPGSQLQLQLPRLCCDPAPQAPAEHECCSQGPVGDRVQSGRGRLPSTTEWCSCRHRASQPAHTAVWSLPRTRERWRQACSACAVHEQGRHGRTFCLQLFTSIYAAATEPQASWPGHAGSNARHGSCSQAWAGPKHQRTRRIAWSKTKAWLAGCRIICPLTTRPRVISQSGPFATCSAGMWTGPCAAADSVETCRVWGSQLGVREEKKVLAEQHAASAVKWWLHDLTKDCKHCHTRLSRLTSTLDVTSLPSYSGMEREYASMQMSGAFCQRESTPLHLHKHNVLWLSSWSPWWCCCRIASELQHMIMLT